MKHYALLGEHLGHSLSVPIHEAVFRRIGLEADYRLIEIPKAEVEERIPQIIRELDGFNITIPYKETVIPFLSEIDPAAAEVRAVNTVVTQPIAKGYNTDVPGFSAMLSYGRIDPAGKPCFVLGTGGASKAIVASLKAMGAASVTCVSRSPGNGAISYPQLADRFSGILVNTTPVGMWPNSNRCPLPQDILEPVLRRAEGVADVIYNPSETVLTAAAKKAGVPAMTGLYMLIAQALEAEKYWQGYQMPDDLIPALLEELKP